MCAKVAAEKRGDTRLMDDLPSALSLSSGFLKDGSHRSRHDLPIGERLFDIPTGAVSQAGKSQIVALDAACL